MSLVSSRLALYHRCTVERDVNIGSDDGWGNPLPPDFEPNVTDLECRAWTAGHETVTNKGTLAVVLEVHLIVSLGSDIAEGDRVVSITLRGGTVQDGPLAVRAVLPQRDHLECILAKAV